jgi:hypothetical protein
LGHSCNSHFAGRIHQIINNTFFARGGAGGHVLHYGTGHAVVGLLRIQDKAEAREAARFWTVWVAKSGLPSVHPLRILCVPIFRGTGVSHALHHGLDVLASDVIHRLRIPVVTKELFLTHIGAILLLLLLLPIMLKGSGMGMGLGPGPERLRRT